MLLKHDIVFIKDLITSKLITAKDRLDRIKSLTNNLDMENEINSDIIYMSDLIKRLEE